MIRKCRHYHTHEIRSLSSLFFRALTN
jgi:hypothetical protein